MLWNERRDDGLYRELRDLIYAGEPPPSRVLESADAIAARRGDMSAGMVQRAFEALKREGLVRQEQGRGTYVCERYQWNVTVTAALASRPPARMIRETEHGEPAVTGLTVTAEQGTGTWSMQVEAADVVPAVAVAVSIARSTGATGNASVNTRPA